MAITNTSLSAACGLNDSIITVTSATGFAVGNLVRVDSEWMAITSAYVAASTTVPVLREGQNGSVRAAHNILSPVATCLASDTLGPAPAQILNPASSSPQLVGYGVSGAITPPTFDTIITINKATAAAMTLVSPSGLADGTIVRIVSTTAAAHTVTYTPGFDGDTTASDVATFVATTGSTMTIMAMKGLWVVLALYNVSLG